MRDDKVYPAILNKGQNEKPHSMSENSFENFETASKKEEYPCLCQAIKYVTFSCRLVGILPIVEDKPKAHASSCAFKVSKVHATISFIIQAVYILYILTTYVSRFLCGPGSANGLEWYVMTFGYFITDCDSLISLMAGSLQSKKTCQLLEKMSKMPGPIGELRNLKKNIEHSVMALVCIYLIVFSSYLYVGWLRFDYEFTSSYYCTMLDQPFGVVLRGVVVLVPTMEIGLVIMVAVLISAKFRDLAETTRLTIENINLTQQNSTHNVHNMEQLADCHEEVTTGLSEINNCVGLQLLMAVSSSLYTMIYYLYRYSTSTDDGMTNNIHERVHYVIGLMYRIGKVVIYMILGQKVMECSQLPLRTLQKAKILNFPVPLQQQVQSLMMQWYDKKATLSALNVIKLGPWLLAPIVGNVATYLLVVLQFRNSYKNQMEYNSTMFESIF